MKMIRYLVITVEAFIKIRFPIAIQIPELYDLIATGYKNLFIDHFNAERLNQTGSDTLPRQDS